MESAWQAGVESRRPGIENSNFMKMNRQTLIALAAVASTLSLQPLARAADNKEAARPAGGDRLAALRERMQDTARELNLTPEQKEKLQTIVRERMEKLRDLRQDTSLSPQEKREKFQAAREEITAEVKKVLTPEQFEKWKAKQGQPAGAGTGAAAREAGGGDQGAEPDGRTEGAAQAPLPGTDGEAARAAPGQQPLDGRETGEAEGAAARRSRPSSRRCWTPSSSRSGRRTPTSGWNSCGSGFKRRSRIRPVIA